MVWRIGVGACYFAVTSSGFSRKGVDSRGFEGLNSQLIARRLMRPFAEPIHGADGTLLATGARRDSQAKDSVLHRRAHLPWVAACRPAGNLRRNVPGSRKGARDLGCSDSYPLPRVPLAAIIQCRNYSVPRSCAAALTEVLSLLASVGLGYCGGEPRGGRRVIDEEAGFVERLPFCVR